MYAHTKVDTSFPSPPQCPGHRMVGDLGPQCPPSHVRGADTALGSTQASESCLLAQCSSQSQNILLMASDGDIHDNTGASWQGVTWLSRGRVLSLQRHIILPGVRGHVITPIRLGLWCIKWRCSAGNYSSELIRCAILLNETLPVLWNDVTPLTCQTLQSVQCPERSANFLF